MTTKKVAKRSWPFDKFAAVVRARAKRLGVKLDASKLKGAYEGGYTVASTVEACSAK